MTNTEARARVGVLGALRFALPNICTPNAQRARRGHGILPYLIIELFDPNKLDFQFISYNLTAKIEHMNI